MKPHPTASAILAIAVTGMLAVGAAFAASPTPDDAVPTPPNDEHGVKPSEGSSTPSGSGNNLSDQLSRSGGVIKPRTDVDPGMHQPAPDPGPQSMPVIPPPGSTGNSLDVKPK
ncbi:MAG: exported protein of unknown function [Rhodospirillales bacterium]|jgi:hypothetical protein|nr:exported protein of unknown function [Rhodospirillales bacterium]